MASLLLLSFVIANKDEIFIKVVNDMERGPKVN